MTNEVPDRIWAFIHRLEGGRWTGYNSGEGSVEFIRKDAACVEVKDEVLYQAMNDGYGRYEDFKRDVLMALTIRTVEDVRREALEEAVRLLELPSGLMTPPAAQRIRNLIDTPAPSRETPASHAEELRKAKAEAWDQGWQERLENEGLNCPIVSNPYRNSTDEGEG